MAPTKRLDIKKRAGLGTAAVALVVLACACGPSPGPPPAPEQQSSGATPVSPVTTIVPSPSTTPTTSPSPTTTPTTTTPPQTGGVSGGGVGFAEAYLPMFESSTDLNHEFDMIQATGAKWVRFDVMWAVVQAGGPTSWDWSATDAAVAAANARGLHVLADLDYTPTWARPSGQSDQWGPTDPTGFAAFAQAAAARYAPEGVNTFEIWNEPNTGFWQPAPNPVAYTALLKASYTAIHSVDPGATVVSGGLAPQGPTLDWVAPDGSGMSPWHFLTAMYAAGAAGSFDAVGLHPYAIPGGPTAAGTWNTFQQTPAIHSLMAANGDGSKAIWGTEAGYYTGTATSADSLQQQATDITNYVTMWQQWSYVGPIFLYTLRDMGTDPTQSEENFGLLYNDYTPKPAYTTLTNLLSG